MPKKPEGHELSDGARAHLVQALGLGGDQVEAGLYLAMRTKQAELINEIPKLTSWSAEGYVEAVAAALLADAIRPELGRALLYAAQLAIAMRAPAK
jgi:hypothetical protein